MKEDFLHYLWKFKKFRVTDLKTVSGEELVIISTGQYLQRSGPDFFNAQIKLNGQKWAGNIEIHLNSSDWYLHRHHIDPAYENVILHVVWTHDTDVFRSNNTPIPVLELKDYVGASLLMGYQQLMTPKAWLYCESHISSTDQFILNNWFDRLFIERLERKALPIDALAEETGRDWEAILFYLLARNFGLNANGDAFYNAARKISYSVLRRESASVTNVEALLLGTCGLLESEFEDTYACTLKSQYSYLLHKYNLDPDIIFNVEFFKHRPDNFPTIRLSQLSNLYSGNKGLFTEILKCDSVEDIYKLFSVGVSGYWESHYQFDRISPGKAKKMSRGFIDLLIINTILPLRFAYAASRGEDDHQRILTMISAIAPEKNAIIDKFTAFGLIAENASMSQALLQLKSEYCNKGRCLDCAIGTEALKSTAVLAKSL